MKTEFQVEGMSCQHCVAAVTNAIREHDDGAQVQVDLAAGRVAVESTQSVEALKAAIDEAGYTVKGEVKGVSPDAASGAAGRAAS
ncbi:cation transporter [Paraburkholderia graminis]|uniref:heavy-metal-associated domain-containing protein n=1 Tax=Paraburkholderia graminis TaxID=60548 RepID=UPI0038BD281B